MSQAKLIGAQLGMMVFGPTGALVGGVAGAVIDAALPWGDDVFKSIVANLLSTRIQQTASRWSKHSDADETINHDLQRAFRDAVLQALIDIGGPTCFRSAWSGDNRDVPAQVVYLTTARQRALPVDQVCEVFAMIVRSVEQNDALPLQPPAGQEQATAFHYLESATSQAMADSLYVAVTFPLQRQLSVRLRDLPGLEDHLRRHLLDRALIHLGEMLKQQTKPWRAFNRWILEDLRTSMAQMTADNRANSAALTALGERLDLLLNQTTANQELDRLTSVTASSVGVVRLDSEDRALLVDALIDGVTRQQTQQITELRQFIDRQFGKILEYFDTAKVELIGQLAANQDELLKRLEQLEYSVTLAIAVRSPETQQRGQIVTAFRAETLRFHRTQSVPWRGAGGVSLPLDRVYIGQNLLPWSESANEGGWAEEGEQAPAYGRSPEAALLDQRTIVVLGQPGSGKTMMLHALGLQLATTCRLGADGAVLLGFLPVFVSLAGFTKATDDLGAEPAARLMGYVQRALDARAPGITVILDDLMEQGRVAFFFDALDEINGRTEQHAALNGIQALAAGAGSRCLFVVTAREAAYGGSLVLKHPFSVYRVAPLNVTTQQAAIRNWLTILSDLDERDEDVIEDQTERVLNDLERHPGLQQALRNPFLLRMTLEVFLWSGTAAGIAGLGKRFDMYVSRLLAGGGELGAREPAWPDPLDARRYLEQLALALFNVSGRLTLANAEQVLQKDCGLSDVDARRFVRRVQERTGLLVLNSQSNQVSDPEQTRVTFGPHSLFADFLVGSTLARQWCKNRSAAVRLLRQKANDPVWRQAVLFCLSVLYEEEAQRKATFEFVLGELSRAPLWGVRCLHAGLELTVDELAESERQQVYRRVATKADALLHPSLLKNLRLWLWCRTDSALRMAVDAQLDAILALGRLQLCEAADSVMRAALWFSAQNKHLDNRFRKALVDFGPRCLWPGIQIALQVDEEWFHRGIAGVISGWRSAEGIPALEWLLLREEGFAVMAVYGLAHIVEPAVDATFRGLLNDPRYADDALSAGLLAQRPGMLEYVLGGLPIDQLQNHHAKFLLKYALRLSVAEAERTVRTLLKAEETVWTITWVFELGRQQQLPLLRILVGMLRDPDVHLRGRVEEAIPRVLKAGDLDPHFQDSQALLEQILLYTEDWLPQEAARQLHSTTLSPSACSELWNKLQSSETQANAIFLLKFIPPLPAEHRRQFIEWLWSQVATTLYDPGYLFCTLAWLDDRTVIPEIVGRLNAATSKYRNDDEFVKALIHLRAGEAFPYIMAFLAEREDWGRQGALSLALLAPQLSLAQRQAATVSLRPLLSSEQLPNCWTAVFALGELGASDPRELLAQVRDNVLEVQEPVIGLALARLGNYAQLAPHLEAAWQRRDATYCFVVLYAWVALGDRRALNPLLQVFGLSDAFLQSADHLSYGGDLASALRYVKACASYALGRLAVASAGERNPARDLVYGWQQLSVAMDDRSLAWAPGVAGMFRKALIQPAPARVLYEQLQISREPQRAALAWLLGAYEWSELLAWLAQNRSLDSLQIWEEITNMFDDIGTDKQADSQARLASRLNWPEAQPPFMFLMGLTGHADEILRDMVRYYHAQIAKRWRGWLDWRADWLALPRL